MMTWVKDKQGITLNEFVACVAEAREPTLKEGARAPHARVPHALARARERESARRVMPRGTVQSG